MDTNSLSDDTKEPVDDLDDLFVEEAEGEPGAKRAKDKWKVIIVDDEPGVHDATILSLMDVVFDDKEIAFLQAYSGTEAKTLIENNPDSAVMLLDVVMETDDAGLQVVKHIRNTLNNNLLRIILRTGQPGQAPEDKVIMQYEINDYKSKNELTKQKLFTTMVSALRDYRNLVTIDGTKRGLEQIIAAFPTLFEVQSMDDFISGILTQLTSLLRLDEGSVYHIDSSFVANKSSKAITIVKGTGVYGQQIGKPAKEVLEPAEFELLLRAEAEQTNIFTENSCVVYFKNKTNSYNMVYIHSHRQLNEIDKNMVEIFCNNISMAFENIEKHKIQEAMKLARDIQMGLLPVNFSDIKEHGVDLYAFMQPAKEVGGDLYDFFFINDTLLCFVIGDVTDKGVPAAFFMAVTKTLIRAVAKIYSDTGQILRVVNNDLCRNNEKSMFVTLFLGIIDTKTGVCSYSNGGHNPPYLIDNSGEVKLLKISDGIPAGIMEESEYNSDKITFSEGDAIFLYTDGVTEAMDTENKIFDDDRLIAVLSKNQGKSSKTIVEDVVAKLSEFTTDAVQSDDITILCFNYKPNS
ncbi:MAG: SpoIIE family protein phosphatase [Nitrospirae bacterium]|nr:SpoIIE family protein phosphatase [Nitrospirota bacterium]MBF0534409.1 SpoIIE family protein phosphatase [Nitrospirota bacterium]MBF0615610.1 SpoIIE family protein phosphatase [Nitrospirota bacterium]